MKRRGHLQDSRGFVACTALVMAALLLVVAPPQPAYGINLTLTVDSVGDSVDASPGDGVCATAGGVCTLRAAIQEANADPGSDTVRFDIVGGCGTFCTISPASPLPPITYGVFIDGYSQPGAAFNDLEAGSNAVLKIELSGTSAGAASGLTLTSGDITVRGLAINGFTGSGISGNGIYLEASGSKIWGNFLGTDSTGTIDRGNAQYGLRIQGAERVRVGDGEPANANVISGNTYGVGIVGTAAQGNRVEGNYIGTDASGTLDLGNSTFGVFVDNGSDNVIGGTPPEDRNVISGNDIYAMQINFGSGNWIQGNNIGTDVTGSFALANGNGIYLYRTLNDKIGGTEPGAGNLISGNTSGAIVVDGGTASNGSSPATGNAIQGNRIGTDATGAAPMSGGSPRQAYGITFAYNAHDNLVGGLEPGASNTIAFHLFEGIAVNGSNAIGNAIRGNSIHDNGMLGIESVNGGNTNLAPPIITSSSPVSGTACPGCHIDVFSDNADEGRIYEGSVDADGSGAWTFGAAVTGPYVAATATDANNNTSQFGHPCASGASLPDLVVLECANGFTDVVEAGATITQLGTGFGGTPGEGPVSASGLAFACGTPAVANFSGVTATVLGGPPIPGMCNTRPRDIISTNAQFAARVTSSGVKYGIDFLSWGLDDGTCVDADAGVSCARAIGRTSYLRTPTQRTLTVTPAGTGTGSASSAPAGIACPTDCSEAYANGALVALTATADPESRFVGFGGAADCADGSVTLSADINCTATFDIVRGSVGSATGQGPVRFETSAGSLALLAAVPEAALPVAGKPAGVSFPYGFLAWTVTGLATGQSITATITYPAPVAAGSPYWKVIGATWVDASSLLGSDDGDTDLTLTITDGGLGDADGSANGSISDPGGPGLIVVAPTRTLTVHLSGPGSGTVTSNPAGIDCGLDCTEAYAQGTVVSLIPVASPGSQFDLFWMGDADCLDGSVTLATDVTCTANFVPQRTLTIFFVGDGSGTVSSNPAGITCSGASCVGLFDSGTVVSLSGHPTPGSGFGGLSGDPGCNYAEVTMISDVTCWAAFDLFQPTLYFWLLGTGSGIVTSSPAGLVCSDTFCNGSFDSGTVVEFSAVAAPGSTFTGFTGYAGEVGCEDGHITTISHHACIATFDLIPPVTLTVSLAGSGSGSGIVTSTPAGISCGVDCSETYVSGTVVDLTPAVSGPLAADTTFAGFTGDADCADGSVTLTADITCAATFTLIPRRTLTVSLAGSGTGSVTSNPAGISCGADCSETYISGTVVSLIPAISGPLAADTTFAGFTGDADCADGSVTLSADITCIATFNITTRRVASATGLGDVTVSTDAGSLDFLAAVPEAALTAPGKPAGVSFRFGFFSWVVSGLFPGERIHVTMTFPSPVEAGSSYWKLNGSAWLDGSSLLTGNDGDAVLTLTIIDGGPGDADGVADGLISDPGGPGLLVPQRKLSVLLKGAGTGSVTKNPPGTNCSVDGTDCSRYDQGTVVVLTPLAAPGSKFAGFGGDADCTDGTVTMSANRNCTATFTLVPQRKLSVLLKGAGTGSVTKNPPGTNCSVDGTDCSRYDQGTVVVLTPLAAPGSKFAGFGGDADCTDGTVTMSVNRSCTATFRLVPTRTLTIKHTGTGSGSVMTDPPGLSNCSVDGSVDCTTYVEGTVVVLTAMAAPGSTFAGWTGECIGGTVTMNRNRNCVATFRLVPTRTLTIKHTGTGSGSVMTDPPGLSNCSVDGSVDCTTYVEGTVVVLTATAAPGSVFVDFGGDVDCRDGVVTMSVNLNCTARFTLVPQRTLLVKHGGSGTGSVTFNPPGIAGGACGLHPDGDCGSFDQGTVVTLSATADYGSTFAGWAGACAGGTITMTVNRSCTATFTLLATRTLTIAPGGNGTGTVTRDPAGLACPPGSDFTCARYVVGQLVGLTAVAAFGSTFAGWTGDCAGGVVTMSVNRTCTATFVTTFVTN